MNEYLHYYETEDEFNRVYNGENYVEPWVSVTKNAIIPIGDCSSVDLDYHYTIYDSEDNPEIVYSAGTFDYINSDNDYWFQSGLEEHQITATGTTEIDGVIYRTITFGSFSGLTFVDQDYLDNEEQEWWSCYVEEPDYIEYAAFTQSGASSVGDTAKIYENTSLGFTFIERNPDVGTYDINHAEDQGAEVTSINYDEYETEELNRVDYNKYIPEELKQPLTFEILSGGTIYWGYESPSFGELPFSALTIEYSKNGGEWTEIAATKLEYLAYFNGATSGTPIEVQSGDILRFRGNNFNYGYSQGYSIYLFGCRFASSFECYFNVYGNIMSLSYPTDFATENTITHDGQFGNLFYGCAGVRDASRLILPTEISPNAYGCFSSMFCDCHYLTNGPELLAKQIPYEAYSMIFNGCYNLTKITCLLEVPSENDYYAWSSDLPENGTIVKYSGMDISDLRFQIPNSWTILDADV